MVIGDCRLVNYRAIAELLKYRAIDR